MCRGLAHVILTALACAGILPGTAAQETTGPSTSVSPYLRSHLPGVLVKSILTVDDGSVPKTGGGTTRLVGIPDGIGAIDGNELMPAEPAFFYLLVNHELGAGQGIVRDHGVAGSFVSKWKIDKLTHEVVEGDDLVKQTFAWDRINGVFVATPLTFDRLCSADRPASTALFNTTTLLGTDAILYLSGEEVTQGRAFAHVVTGPDAGRSYHLEHFGFAKFENVVLSPAEQDTTVAVALDDESDGEIYVYVGGKTATGNPVERAGLVGGKLYALAVVGKPYELDDNLATAVGPVEPFTLKLIGQSGNRPLDAADMEARGTDTLTPPDPAQTFESLKMGAPEDGVWDARPERANFFYFVTKGTSSNGIDAPTRLWQLEFTDIAQPALGGSLTRLADGPELRLGSLDNLTFAILDGVATLYLQEDLGGDSRLGKIWEYDLDSGTLSEMAEHDAERFVQGGAGFLTTNEESSGIVSLAPILGEGWFATDVQVHSGSGLSNTTELVQHGQLLLLNVDGHGLDLRRERVVGSGALWDYRVDGVDPGAGWNDAGFSIDANWNVDTSGTPTGPVPTMLGYGEAADTLVSDLVQPPAPRAAAYYFRYPFDLPDPTDVIRFDLYMKVDDGAAVYINGTEVARHNLGLDVAVTNNTFAASSEPSERNWKHFPVTGATPVLQPTGNVVAVSVHQQSATNDDLRLDLELIAWRTSPDGGAAATMPSGVALVATDVSIELAWDAQSDAKFFQIERQASGDVTWTVLEFEFPGQFSSYVDTNLPSGSTYNYRLYAANVHGRSALSATVSGDLLEPPVLTPIADQSVAEGLTLNIPLSATDPDTGDTLTYSSAGLPAFCALSDNGDGSGAIDCAPGLNDAGTVTVTVVVTDDGTPPLQTSDAFELVVTPSLVDTDGDGVVDTDDNCVAVANPFQTDGNGDGFGNACDADLDNNCVVGVPDLGLLRVAFFSTDAEADFNSDGIVNPIDLGIMRLLFFQPPGPSGVTDVCDPIT